MNPNRACVPRWCANMLSVLTPGFAALLALPLCAQQLQISSIELGAENRARVHYSATSNYYYLLLRGDTIASVDRPVAAALFSVTNATLIDPTNLLQSAFYRLREIAVADPFDSDGDGLDDVFELLRPLYLNPLNPNDGPVAPPTPTITYPTNATTSSFVIFSGRAPTNTLIRVEGGAAYVTNMVDSTGNFEVTVPLNGNRLNRLFVSAVNEFGQSSPPAPIDILQDSTDPYLFIDLPTNGMVLTAENTLVAGRVGDTLSGFLGLNVAVNGQPANVDVGIGPNGTFQRAGVPLALGTNEIIVVATDRLGNSTTKQVTVIRREPVGPRLLAISGDLQETNILRRLAEPLTVRATQENGAPIPNALVNFEVTRSDGRLLPVNTNQLASDITSRPDYSSNGAMFLQLRTDAAGEARAWWTMGSDAGHANNRVTVSSASIEETVAFCASAFALPASQINVGSGNNQRGETFGPAAEPLKVWVSDGNNPAAGIPVTFRVRQGGGTLRAIIADDGASPAGPGLRAASRASASFALPMAGAPAAPGDNEVTVFTSMTGHAEVDFTYGPLAGHQSVEATFPGYSGLPTAFSLHAVARLPGQPTRFVGIVQDNAVQPIGGAWVELEVAGAHYQTTSDAQGRFAFSDIASGAGHLKVDASYAGTLGTNAIPTNTFPSLQYTVLLVPNAENSLPGPVLLPRLNSNNFRLYYGTNDIVLTCQGVAGLKMFIKANSMKHPGGEIVSPGRPALLSLNQVHHDDIPMPMPDGAAPPFAWTLQPGGATFDPPVAVEYPNMSGLAPGAAAFFLTFNHDTERFEIVASGHVVADGSKIVTDPGVGLTISGWGGNCPPYTANGGACYVSRGADCNQCNSSGNIVPKPDGTACDDKDPCTPTSACKGGSCTGNPPSGGSSCSTPDAGGPPPLDIRWTETSDPSRNSSTSITGFRNLNKQTCYNPATKSWEIRVSGQMIADANMNIANQGWIEPDPRDGGNVTSANYCEMINRLINVKSRAIQGYCTLESVRLHEMFHRTNDLPPLAAAAAGKFWGEVRKISVACKASDPAAGQQEARDAYDREWAKFQADYTQKQTDFSTRHDARKCDGAYLAGQGVLNALADRIRAYATAKGWDTSNPCLELETPCPSPAQPSPLHGLAASTGPLLTNIIGNFSLARVTPGSITNLVVLGMYDDGTVSPLPGTVLIEYRVDNPAVASINANGQIVAASSGITLVTATLTPPGAHLPWTLPARVLVLSAADRDGDGIPNAIETSLSLNPDDPADAELDPDMDGLSNFFEYLRATDRLNPDTDGDGAADGLEVDSGEDPLLWPELDHNWQVTVAGQLVPVNPDGSFTIRNISAPDNFGPGGPGTPPDFVSDDFVRVIGQRDYHGNMIYAFSEPFQIRSGTSFTVPGLTYTRIAPPAPESITAIPDNTLLTALGQTTQVRVWGTLANGTNTDLTARTLWTSYRSSNPAIATVDPDGVVTARGRGMVFITAVNDGATSVCQIDVSPGDLLTEVRGFIRDTNGVPASGIILNLVGFATPPVTSGVDGSFVFTNVPSGLGNFQIIGRLITSNAAFFVTSPILFPVPDGITDAGNLILKQGVAWIGAASGVWHGPTNWSNGQVPGPASDVFIGAAPGVTVTISQGSNVVNNLVITSPLRLTGGSLRVPNGISASSPVQLSGGTLSRTALESVGGNAVLLGTNGTLDRVTLNGNLEVLNGTLNVVGGLVLNGVARVGHPSSGSVGSLNFLGSQALSGSGSVLFGNNGCNTLRLTQGGTALTNRVFIHGHSGQLPYSSCAGGPQNVTLINEAPIAADLNGGTITVRGQPVRNFSQLLAGPGTLRIFGLAGNLGTASVSVGGHLDLDGAYTNNLALPVNGGTLTLNGDWFNAGELRLTNSVLNLDGTFGLGDLGNIIRSGGSVRVTGLLNGAGGSLNLDASTGNWSINGGTLRQLTVNSADGALLLATSTAGLLDGVTLNCDLDVQTGSLNVTNGLILNGLMRVGNPTNGFAGSVGFLGSQAISGTGSVLFGNNGCNSLRLTQGGTTLTNRVFIHGHSGQLPYSTCAGGPANVRLVNEATIAADRTGGTIYMQAQPMRNVGQLLAGPGTLRIVGLAGDLGAASVSAGGHLDLAGTYTNNLALPVNVGTLTLNGDWFNAGELRLTNSVLNLDGTFGLGDLGNIIRSGGSVRVTGLLNGAGDTLNLDAATGNWSMSGGTLRQLTVNSADGALLLATSTAGLLDGVTLNCDVDAQGGSLNVTNGLVLNGLMRVGNPTNSTLGTVGFFGSQAIGGSGSVLFGNHGCNSLRLMLGGTILTNRLLIHGHSGQVPYSTCVGGPQNVSLINEATIAADRTGGTIYMQAQSMRNVGQLLAGPGTLRILGLAGDLGTASVSAGGHLDLRGTYTNNLALPVNGGTLTLGGDWFNAGELRLTNSVLNLDGTFGLGDLGNIIRSGGSVRVTGLLNGGGDTLNLDATTGNWTMDGGTLRQLTVNTADGALLLATSTAGLLDGVTLNSDLDVQAGSLNVTNGLVLNGLMRVGNPTNSTLGTVGFFGSQAISGSGSVLFGNHGCNSLRLIIGGTTLTNRVLIHGHSGQLPYSACVGGPQNVSLINEATIAADRTGGTIIAQAQPMRNVGQLLAGPGTLRIVGLTGDLGNARVNTGHLDLSGTYTNNLALPVNGGTLTLNGDWFNAAELRLTNSVLNLDGTFGLGDLGSIIRSGGSVRVTGLLNGGGDTLHLDATTGNWSMNGGTLRQLTVNASGGALLLATGSGGTLDGVTLNSDVDAQAGSLSVTNGLVLNGLMRVGNPTNATAGSIGFLGSQAISGSGSVLFGNHGCNSLRLMLGGTTLTNRLLIHGHSGQLPYSACVGGPQNVGLVNEATIAADRSGGTIIAQAQPMRNVGQLLAGPGTLRIVGLAGDLGSASVSAGGHLELGGAYTNSLALPVNGGTLTLNGDWFNASELRLTNSVLNLGGAFGLGDLGNIIRVGGSVRVTGLLNGAGGNLNLDATTGNWSMNGGTLRQLTVNSADGVLLIATATAGMLDGVTLNCNLDAQAGSLNVTNGLVLNGLMRVGNPTNATAGSIGFLGSQAISGSGSVVFGNHGCNSLRLLQGGTILTNRLLIHGHSGQLPFSACVGGVQNVSLVNEATISADVNLGTITIRAQPFINNGVTNSLNGGRLVINP
jgi:hypothetical protein